MGSQEKLFLRQWAAYTFQELYCFGKFYSDKNILSTVFLYIFFPFFMSITHRSIWNKTEDGQKLEHYSWCRKKPTVNHKYIHSTINFVTGHPINLLFIVSSTWYSKSHWLRSFLGVLNKVFTKQDKECGQVSSVTWNIPSKENWKLCVVCGRGLDVRVGVGMGGWDGCVGWDGGQKRVKQSALRFLFRWLSVNLSLF